jgi:chromosome segregation ATPase
LRIVPHSAVEDFQPRSGVLTAVEDAVASSTLDWTVVEVPAFHGVAVLVEGRLLAEHEAVARWLAELGSAGFLRSQARSAELARVSLAAELASTASRSPQADEAPPSEPAPATDDARESFWLRRRVEELERALAAVAEEDVAEEGARGDSPRLLVQLAEHRAQRQALEWRLERLEEELASRGGELEATAGDRDSERRAAVELQVRLESAERALDEERRSAAQLRGRVAALEGEVKGHASELAEALERERLAQGRLAHREDALQAAEAEAAELRSELEAIRVETERAERRLDQLADHVLSAAHTRRARAGRRVRGWARKLTRRASSRPLDAALELVESRDRAGAGAAEPPTADAEDDLQADRSRDPEQVS